MALSLISAIKNIFKIALANIEFVILAILLLIFLYILIKRWFFRIKYRRYYKIERLLAHFESDPLAFEQFIADLYAAKGYKTEVTGGSGDGGKDIIMTKGRHKYAVEVKLYRQDHKVDRERIQKLHSAMIDSDCDCGIFVTTSDYTDPAFDYAEKYNIETINGEDLSRMIKNSTFKEL